MSAVTYLTTPLTIMAATVASPGERRQTAWSRARSPDQRLITVPIGPPIRSSVNNFHVPISLVSTLSGAPNDRLKRNALEGDKRRISLHKTDTATVCKRTIERRAAFWCED